MPLIAAISISQGANISQFTITDASNYGGSDPKANFSARKLILYKSDGTVYRQPGQLTDEIDFDFGAYPTDQITITGLIRDLALSATMILTPVVSQPGSTYSITTKFALVGFTMTALYERQKELSIEPRYESNTQFVTDSYRLLLEAETAIVAASANDITGSQLCLDRANRIITDNRIPY